MSRFCSSLNVILLIIYLISFNRGFVHGDDDSRQSPIDINPRTAKKLTGPPIELKNFDSIPSQLTATNTGHTIQLTGDWDDSNIPTISGGSLGQSYKFVQIHFHWGATKFWGSEHIFSEKPYASESHAVFMKSDLNNFQDALNETNGIVVLGSLYSLVKKSSSATSWFAPLAKAISSVSKAASSIDIPPMPLQFFVNSNNLGYYEYPGSLTTPPYSENVEWFILTNQKKGITSSQLKLFHKLLDEEGDPIVGNRRRLQDLNGRTIYYYFPNN